MINEDLLNSEELVVPTYKLREKCIDHLGRSYGTGRRKTSVARVWVKEGSGQFTVNYRSFIDYFQPLQRAHILSAMLASKTAGSFDVMCTVKGGGISGNCFELLSNQARTVYFPLTIFHHRSGRCSEAWPQSSTGSIYSGVASVVTKGYLFSSHQSQFNFNISPLSFISWNAHKRFKTSRTQETRSEESKEKVPVGKALSVPPAHTRFDRGRPLLYDSI